MRARLACQVEGITDEEVVWLTGGAKLTVGACGAILRTVDAADIVVVVLVGSAGESASQDQ